nr:hypothetical protein Ade03nite_94250 [Actinoplanes derwentensis]
MLEKLSQVPWARLGHAYGSASDVPDQIRALRSGDAAVREAARRALNGNIFHQGTRYEASAFAVPFLLELLADPVTPERADLLALLTSLAIGVDESWLPGPFPVASYREQAAGGEPILRAAPLPSYDDDSVFRYVEALDDRGRESMFAFIELSAYDAVRTGVPLFRDLLSAGEPRLRVAAAYALAWFPEDASAIRPALIAGTSDPNPAVAATALVSLGLLIAPTSTSTDLATADVTLVAATRTPADTTETTLARFTRSSPCTAEPNPDPATQAIPARLDRTEVVPAGTTVVAVAFGAAGDDGAAIIRAALGDGRELVRWGAAVALAGLDGPATGRAVAEELLKWAGRSGSRVPEVPFLDGDLSGLAGLALRQLGDEHADAAFEALLVRIPAVSGPDALPVVGEALRRAFPGGRVGETACFADLDQLQQRLLRKLAESPTTWQWGESGLFANFTLLVNAYGLPRNAEDMRAFVTTN